MAIIRYTTPTIKFTFSAVSVTDITVAYLVIKQNGSTVIERGINTAVITDTADESSLAWTLTQAESGSLAKSTTMIYCDWKLSDGTRGRSNVKTETVEDCGKQSVI